MHWFVTTLFKTTIFVPVVALYARPLEIAKIVGIAPPDRGFTIAHANAVRCCLSILLYSCALSWSPWFRTVLTLIALQTVCLASALADEGILHGVMDIKQEKELFENAAIFVFALLNVITIFWHESTSGKDYYRRRLLAFYAKHNPDKIGDIGKILKKYEGKEELLFTRLHRKYSRVLSHTAAEDAVDDLNHEGIEEDEDAQAESFVEEVEYIQGTSSPTSSSTSSYSKTVTTTFSSSNGVEEEKTEVTEEVDEATLPMLQPRVKSPVTESPVGKGPSVPPSPALSQPKSGSAAGSAAGSRTSSPSRSPSNSVRLASEEARRALQERVQQRVAQLQSRTKKKA